MSDPSLTPGDLLKIVCIYKCGVCVIDCNLDHYKNIYDENTVFLYVNLSHIGGNMRYKVICNGALGYVVTSTYMITKL
jgi:hypothetical protein